MEPDTFKRSIPEHTIWLDGYMDAVGRVAKTNSELYALCLRRVSDGSERVLLLAVRSAKTHNKPTHGTRDDAGARWGALDNHEGRNPTGVSRTDLGLRHT